MASISQYFEELDRQRDQLATNLTAMGVTSTSTEKLNTLVPKVLQIPKSGGTVSSKTLVYNAENRDGIYLKYKDTFYSLDEFTAVYPAFCSGENGYALNYSISLFGWDSQIYTCCTRSVSIKPSMQIAMRFIAGSAESGIMRLVQSGSDNPADIITAAQTEDNCIDLPLQWFYSDDYVTTLTPCEKAPTGDYYLVWIGRSNNCRPLIKNIEIYP